MMTNGLEDVVAAQTVLSAVDGAAGRLTIRGHTLDEIAGAWPFERAVHLLLDGFFDDLPDVDALTAALGAARRDVLARCAPMLDALAGRDVYDGVRAGVALLPDGDTLADALRLLAAPAVLTPALVRRRAGRAVVAPDATLGHAADVVRMLTGAPAPALARALDTYLVTVCDHGLNASTFAARVVASTRAGLASAVLAGLAALKGPLHGGAPGPVLAMLDAVAARGDARAWLVDALARGERLMGFGHRVYRVRDPRADALKGAVRRLAASGDARVGPRLVLAEQVERAALDVLRERKPDRALETNVEFYTALLLEALGFPPAAFTCVFAMGRTAGWLAHAREQQATGRLIRPQSRYVGPEPNRAVLIA
jgi:citrate synthase